MKRHCKFTFSGNRCFWPCSGLFVRRAASALMVVSVSGFAQVATEWPKVELPDDAIAYSIGEQLVVNGLPMRLQGFASTSSPLKIAAWFRESLGKPVVENSVARKLILGRPRGAYFVTIQLEPVGRGTRGLVSVSHLKVGYENLAAAKSTSDRLLTRFPAGSRLVSSMESSDRGKLDKHLVISNSYNEEINRNRLAAMMRDDGLVLERDAAIDPETARTLPASASNGRIMFFKGPGKEAIGVIFRDSAGQTTIVLNTVTAIGHFR